MRGARVFSLFIVFHAYTSDLHAEWGSPQMPPWSVQSRTVRNFFVESLKIHTKKQLIRTLGRLTVPHEWMNTMPITINCAIEHIQKKLFVHFLLIYWLQMLPSWSFFPRRIFSWDFSLATIDACGAPASQHLTDEDGPNRFATFWNKISLCSTVGWSRDGSVMGEKSWFDVMLMQKGQAVGQLGV